MISAALPVRLTSVSATHEEQGTGKAVNDRLQLAGPATELLDSLELR
jgi:hypothetical protein